MTKNSPSSADKVQIASLIEYLNDSQQVQIFCSLDKEKKISFEMYYDKNKVAILQSSLFSLDIKNTTNSQEQNTPRCYKVDTGIMRFNDPAARALLEAGLSNVYGIHTLCEECSITQPAQSTTKKWTASR